MGRLREYFAYLAVEPKWLQEFKPQLSHLELTEDHKKIRRELKVYKKKKKQ